MIKSAILAAVIALFCVSGAGAGVIVVVAPDSPMAPYQEALQGVCDALGACPPVLTASKGAVPDDARVVIALGGRAARLRYPERATVVTALTPGFDARPGRPGGVVHVRLTYSPAEFARRLKLLRPDVGRAVLLWSEPASGRFAAAVRAAAVAQGWEALPVQVANPEDAPALLRSLPAAEAVWLAPDPELVTPTTFDATLEYARSRGAAFFAPAPGLADRGAVPGLAPSFRAVGMRAGELARAALGRTPESDEAYPDEAAGESRALLVSTLTVPSTQR